MRAWLPLFILLVACQVRAQHFIDLPTAGPVALPPGIHLDSVITSFPDSASIGVVMKGMGNKRVPAFLTGGVTASVHALLRNGAASETGLHCTMRLNALEVEEMMGTTTENCFCGLNFELLTRTDSGWYRIFDHAATSMLKGGLDATSQQAENIAVAFTRGFAAYTRAQEAGWSTRELLAEAPKAGVFAGADRAYAVLQSGVPARGLYADFQDFRDQRPDTSVAFTLKPFGNEYTVGPLVKLKTEKGAQVPEALWGVSDGRNAYINFGNHFLRLDRTANVFTSNYLVGQVSTGVTFAVGLSFGLIGLAVLMSTAPEPMDTPVELDLLTGSLQPARDHFSNEALEVTSDHLFLYSRYSAEDAEVEMLVYDGHEAFLRREDYRTLRLAPRPGEVPVAFRMGTAPPVTVNISTAHIGAEPLVYLVRVRKDGGITVDRLNAEMAASTLRRLDPTKEVK